MNPSITMTLIAIKLNNYYNIPTARFVILEKKSQFQYNQLHIHKLLPNFSNNICNDVKNQHLIK